MADRLGDLDSNDWRQESKREIRGLCHFAECLKARTRSILMLAVWYSLASFGWGFIVRRIFCSLAIFAESTAKNSFQILPLIIFEISRTPESVSLPIGALLFVRYRYSFNHANYISIQLINCMSKKVKFPWKIKPWMLYLCVIYKRLPSQAHRRYLADGFLFLKVGWYMGDSWVIHGWFMGDSWVIHGWLCRE